MTKTYEIATFLQESVPVELAERLLDLRLVGSRAELRCGCSRYEPQVYDYYGTRCETVFSPPQPCEPATLQLDFCTPEIIRFRFHPGTEIPEAQTPMVVGPPPGPVAVDLAENDEAAILETEALRVTIWREPLRLEVHDRDGSLLWSTRPVDIEPLRRPEVQWNPPQERWLFLHRYAYPLGMHRGDCSLVFASFDLRHDEHIFGLGEDFGNLDKRGTRRRLWLQEAFGNASPAAYKQIPFYMSTRGYGLFANTSNAMAFHIGDLEHTALSLVVDDTCLLDFYFIYGPTLKEILPRYTAITGQPAVPPKWSFGLWMSRISYRRQDQVEAVAKELREHRIPCDVIHVDTDWYESEWECDLCFGKEKFPDPEGMTARLRQDGFRVSLWQWPNTVVTSSLFQEGLDKGYLAKRPSGQAHINSGFMTDAGFIDYSNPEAVAWIQAKFKDLFRLGIAAIKVDFGEGAPPDALYHGVPSESMHNLYPLLYSKAIFEATEQFYGQGRGVIWVRSAWAGSQRYPVHWSGDGLARFEDLPCVLRAALGFGLSGFPFYSHDIGGFSGLPSPELYVRWAQLGFFSSHSRCHGVPPREPWAYGQKAEAIFRQYAELRYRLLPYIYSEAVECGKSSLPMMRALVLDYQDDPMAACVDDQYLFGRNLLVAPILDETNRRRVYLPPGMWFDFWTKELLEGGRWLEIGAPLDILPLYVRAGAILPFGPLVQHTGERPWDPLTVEIYGPLGQGSYTVYDEDKPSIPVRYVHWQDLLEVSVGCTPGRAELVLYGTKVVSAVVDGQPAWLDATTDGGIRVGLPGGQQHEVVLRP